MILRSGRCNFLLHKSFISPEDLAGKGAVDISNWYAEEYLPQWAEGLARNYLLGFAPYQIPQSSSDFVGRQQERYKDAHEHLDRARDLFLKLKERGTAAQVDDTRARTLLAEGHIAEAERIARAAVKVLERGDQQAYLAEALTTQGITLARLGRHRRSQAVLERAVEVAETAGDLEGAGRAKLSIIEELGERISTKDLVANYRSAIELLKSSQDPSTGKRLIECAERLFGCFGTVRK